MNQDFVITKINRVILVGEKEYKENKIVFRHPLRSNELIFNFSGQSTVCFNGKKLKIEENTIRFLPKGENREYVIVKEEEGECIDVFFDTDIPISPEAFVLKCAKSETVGKLFRKLFSVWVGKGDGYYFECISLLYQIFAQLQKEEYVSEKQYRAIQPAIAYIERFFLERKISVSDLADCCSISPSYLKKLFLKKFGMPPSKYIIGLKIRYACDLLQSGFYQIAQVAEQCGYGDVYFFSRQFKKYMGISPSQFVLKYKSSK